MLMKEPKEGSTVTVQELSKDIHHLWTSTQGTTQTHSSTANFMVVRSNGSDFF